MGVVEAVMAALVGGAGLVAVIGSKSKESPVPVGTGTVLRASASAISKEGITAIQQHEALRLSPYFDGGGVLTVGWGHAVLAGDGIKYGVPITKRLADQLLVNDLAIAESAVRKLVTVPMTQGIYDALVSFVFNVGVGQFSTSTLLKLLNQGEVEAASEQLHRWKYDNGVVVAGLVNRRKYEYDLWWS